MGVVVLGFEGVWGRWSGHCRFLHVEMETM